MSGDVRVGGDESRRVELSLRHEHAVERIPVQERQFGHALRMRR